MNHEEATGETMLDKLLERVAARLGGDATVRMVYGEPIQRGGVTVVPVARARYGFGAGRASADGENSSGGGGGGAQVSPVGYIEIKDGDAQFHGIHSVNRLALIAVGSAVAASLLAGAATRLFGRKEPA